MKKLMFLMLLAAGCGAVSHAQFTAVSSQPVYGFTAEKQFNDHYYRFYTGQVDFEAARKVAVRDGGYLVLVESAAENAFLAGWLEAYVGKFFIGSGAPAEKRPGVYANWLDPDATEKNKNRKHAVIEFLESGGKWTAADPDTRAAGFIVEFNSKPKPPPKVAETLGIMEDTASEAEGDEPEAAEKNEPVLSDLPAGGISANLLFSKYLYAGGIFRERYLDKEITVAGITRVADIREITEKDRFWSKYKGKYFMRLLGDNIICFLNTPPLIEGDNTRVMVKVHGKITKGPQFQQVILDDARFMNYRRVQPQRRLSSGKPDETMKQAGGILTKFDSLLDKGTFEIQVNKEGGTLTCTLGADPDGYGMELYWLKRTSNIEQLIVGVIGMKSLPDDEDSPLVDCRISGWGDPAASGGRRRPPPVK